MASENEMKIIFGADTSPLRAEVAKGADAIEDLASQINKTANEAVKGFDRLNKAVNSLPGAFEQVVKSSITLTKINKSISEAANAAEKGRVSFDLLGKTPLNNLPQLDAQLKTIKATLSTGLKANIDTSGLNPQTFDNVADSARDLINVLLNTASASKELGASFNVGFAQGIVLALEEAGVSVQEFRAALSGLNASGVNIAPLITILDQIEQETASTTTSVKILDATLKQLSAGGPPKFPLPPLAEISAVSDKIKEIKAVLASGFDTNIAQISVAPIDLSGVQNEVNATTAGIRDLGNTVQNVTASSAAEFNKLGNAIADVPEAVNNIKTGPLEQLRKSIGDLGVEALKSGKQLEVFVNSPKTDKLRQLDTALKAVKTTISTGFNLDKIKFSGQTFSKAAQGTTQLNNALTKTKSQAAGAGSTLTDLTRVTQDLPFGFIAIQNNIGPLLESFGRLKKETGSTGGALKALGSSMVGAGGIGFAFAVVGSLITKAIQQYGSIDKALQALFGHTDALAEAQEQLNKSYAESTASVAGEIAKLKGLSSIVQDEANSRKTRLNALKELQREYPGVFSNYDLEKKGIAGIKKATDELTVSLVRRAKIAGAQNLISKLTEKQLEKSMESFAESATFGDELAAAFKNILNLTNLTGGAVDQLATRNVLGFKRQTKAAEENKEQIDFVTDALNKMLSASADAGDFEIGGKITGISKEDSELKSLKDQLEKVRGKLESINKLREAGVLPKFREDDAAALEEKVLDLLNKIDQREVKIKIKPELTIDPQLNELELQKVQKTAGERLGSKPIPAPLLLVIDTKSATISKLQASSNEALKRAGLTEYKIPSVEIGDIKLPAEGIQIAGGIDAIIKQARDRLQASIDATKTSLKFSIAADNLGISDEQFQAIVEEFKKKGYTAAEAFDLAVQEVLKQNIGKTLRAGIGNAFASIGEGLGEIFSGGGLEAAAEGFLGIIGDVLQQVGKQIILASALVMSLQKALTQLFTNPAAGLALGIGLVALGAILKKIKLAKGPQKFAEGGIVRGPTLGLVGESGPEAIIPLSRMNGFNGGSAQLGFVASTQVRGEDLLVVIKRAAAANSRMGGNF